MSSDFPAALWDDSDPTYAPFLKVRKGRYCYWVPSKRYIDQGWTLKTVKLDGCPGDGRDIERAAECRRLTRDLVQWWNGEGEGKVKEGTWGWLIQRYIHDEFSAIWDVRPTTRQRYAMFLGKVSAAICDVRISQTNFETLMGWQKVMREKGRSDHYIHKWFRHFGLALSHGIKLREPGCDEVKAIRSEMRIKSAPRRTEYMTRKQMESVVAEADRRGMGHLSLSLMFRFEFMLRGVDVYGQWEVAEGEEGGVVDGGKRWVDGLTWDMFDRNLTTFSKVISKTRGTIREPYTFDLTATPEIRERLMQVKQQDRVGPVIKTEAGLPPKQDVVSQAFRRISRDLKLKDGLRISDARSGAITEAQAMVDPMTLRNAAQHTQLSTTDIYARGRSDSANKVVRLRSESKSKRSG